MKYLNVLILKGSIFNDVCVSICCSSCALIQMKKETVENPILPYTYMPRV